jgi:hypothetical protein
VLSAATVPGEAPQLLAGQVEDKRVGAWEDWSRDRRHVEGVYGVWGDYNHRHERWSNEQMRLGNRPDSRGGERTPRGCGQRNAWAEAFRGEGAQQDKTARRGGEYEETRTSGQCWRSQGSIRDYLLLALSLKIC